MNVEKFRAPEHLSDRSKEIWAALVPQNARTIGRLTLLQTALESLDLADRVQAELAGKDLTVKTLGSGTVHINPLVKLLKESRQQFATIWSALGLSHYGGDGWDYNAWLRHQEKEAAK